MSRHNIADFFEAKIFPRLTVESLYADVQFDGPADAHFHRAVCPLHVSGDATGSLWVDRQTLRWSCLGGCGKAGQSPLAFLNEGNLPEAGSMEYRAAVEKAAALARVRLPKLRDPTPEEARQIQHRERTIALLEAFFFLCYQSLNTPQTPTPWAERVRSRLTSHGFAPAEIRQLPLGMLIDCSEMKKNLHKVGFSWSEIQAAELIADPRLPGRLIGPIRDPSGTVLGFWARDSEDRPPRFLFKGGWRDCVPALCLDTALPAAAMHASALVLVEDVYDAHLCHCRGIKNVAAIGGSARHLTPARWQRIRDLGVSRVVLVLNARPLGDAQIWAALETALEAASLPEIVAIPSTALEDCTTPGQFVRTRGPKQFMAILESCWLHAFWYKANMILDRHRPARGWNEIAKQAAWEEAGVLYGRFASALAKELDEFFLPPLVAELGDLRKAFSLPDTTPKTDVLPPESTAIREPILPESVSDVVCITTVQSPSRPRNGARVPGFCPFHRCDPYFCFCFD